MDRYGSPPVPASTADKAGIGLPTGKTMGYLQRPLIRCSKTAAAGSGSGPVAASVFFIRSATAILLRRASPKRATAGSRPLTERFVFAFGEQTNGGRRRQ